jgi:hypothetical protein
MIPSLAHRRQESIAKIVRLKRKNKKKMPCGHKAFKKPCGGKATEKSKNFVR